MVIRTSNNDDDDDDDDNKWDITKENIIMTFGH